MLDDKLNEFSLDEKTGPKVNEKLSKLVNDLLGNEMDKQKRNDLFDKYPRPENCKLSFPRVNDIIWDLCISGYGRSLDVKLHNIQRSLLKGLTPVVNIINN